MCFLRIRPEHAPMDPPGAAPTLTNIYNEDKYFAPPSSPGPNASPSNHPNAVSPKKPTQPRLSSKPAHAQQQPRHNYPRYHHHESRRAAAGDQPTTTNPPIPKTRRRKKYDDPIPAIPPPKNNALAELNPAATTAQTTTIHGAPPHEDPTRIEQPVRTQIDDGLDVSGAGVGDAHFPADLVHEYDGLGPPPSSLEGMEEDERSQRVEGMRREVEGLEGEARGIGRAL